MNLFTLNYFQLLCLIASVFCGPLSTFPSITVQRYVTKALNGNYPNDNRVKASTNLKSPSSAAALAYMKSIVKEGLCSWLTKGSHSKMLPAMMLPRLSLNLSRTNLTLPSVLLSLLSRIRYFVKMDSFLLTQSASLLWKPLLTQMLLEMNF